MVLFSPRYYRKLKQASIAERHGRRAEAKRLRKEALKSRRVGTSQARARALVKESQARAISEAKKRGEKLIISKASAEEIERAKTSIVRQAIEKGQIKKAVIIGKEGKPTTIFERIKTPAGSTIVKTERLDKKVVVSKKRKGVGVKRLEPTKLMVRKESPEDIFSPRLISKEGEVIRLHKQITPKTTKLEEPTIFGKLKSLITPKKVRTAEYHIGRGGRQSYIVYGEPKQKEGFIEKANKYVSEKVMKPLKIGETGWIKEEKEKEKVRYESFKKKYESSKGIKRILAKGSMILTSPKAFSFVMGAEKEVREQIRERPVSIIGTAALFSVAGFVSAPIATTKIGATALKGIGIIGGGVYAGSKTLAVAKAPTYEKKGRIIGGALVETGAAAGGMVIGSKAYYGVKSIFGTTKISGAGTISQETAVGKLVGKYKGTPYEELSVQMRGKGFSQIKYGKYNVFVNREGQISTYKVKLGRKIISKGMFKTEGIGKPDLLKMVKGKPQRIYNIVGEHATELAYKRSTKSLFGKESFTGTSKTRLKYGKINMNVETISTGIVRASPRVTKITSPTEYIMKGEPTEILFGKPTKQPADVLKIEGLKITKVVQPKVVKKVDVYTKGTFEYSLKNVMRPLFYGRKASVGFGSVGTVQKFKPSVRISTGVKQRFVSPEFSVGEFSAISKGISSISKPPVQLGLLLLNRKSVVGGKVVIGKRSIPMIRVRSLTELKPSISYITKPVQKVRQTPYFKQEPIQRVKPSLTQEPVTNIIQEVPQISQPPPIISPSPIVTPPVQPPIITPPPIVPFVFPSLSLKEGIGKVYRKYYKRKYAYQAGFQAIYTGIIGKKPKTFVKGLYTGQEFRPIIKGIAKTKKRKIKKKLKTKKVKKKKNKEKQKKPLLKNILKLI